MSPWPQPYYTDGPVPCHLDTRETSGDPDWPGSPCLVEGNVCLNCGAVKRP